LQLWGFVQERVVHVDIHQDADTLEVQKRVHIILIALEGEHDPILISGPSLGIWRVQSASTTTATAARTLARQYRFKVA
jgi:hypothetical protein